MKRGAAIAANVVVLTALAVSAWLVLRRPGGGSGAGEDQPARFGFGRPATAAEIASLDIDVMPDGTGLPPGQGTVREGAVVYTARCAVCHGATGVEGPMSVLVGREPGDRIPGRGEPRTVGNYWAYATTLYDYVNRAMPQSQPGSLTPDEVYSVVAWILWRNELIPKDGVMDAATLPRVEMPAHKFYYPDPRPGNLLP